MCAVPLCIILAHDSHFLSKLIVIVFMHRLMSTIRTGDGKILETGSDIVFHVWFCIV